MKAIFLDRDATVTVGVPKYDRVDSLDKVELLPNSLKALEELSKLPYAVFFVTNQAGITEGRITLDDFHAINDKILRLIEPSGIKITQTYFCPHAVDEGCDCRKPGPKLLFDAAREHDIELKDSYMIGDRVSDVQAGINAGTKTILVQTGIPGTKAPDATYTAADLLDAVRYLKHHTSS